MHFRWTWNQVHWSWQGGWGYPLTRSPEPCAVPQDQKETPELQVSSRVWRWLVLTYSNPTSPRGLHRRLVSVLPVLELWLIQYSLDIWGIIEIAAQTSNTIEPSPCSALSEWMKNPSSQQFSGERADRSPGKVIGTCFMCWLSLQIEAAAATAATQLWTNWAFNWTSPDGVTFCFSGKFGCY